MEEYFQTTKVALRYENTLFLITVGQKFPLKNSVFKLKSDEFHLSIMVSEL